MATQPPILKLPKYETLEADNSTSMQCVASKTVFLKFLVALC